MQFSMLIINNNRSKAYLQNLIKNNYIPEKIVLLNDSNVSLPEHTENDLGMSKNTSQKFIRRLNDLNIEFDEKEHVLQTIKQHNIDHCILDTLDINSTAVISEMKNLSTEYVIYSGPGGSILRKEILSLGKKYLHVHPGWLPKFRGSTTIYYSMLLNSEVGASVIIFEEGIDEGPVLYKKNYKINEKGIDFDYVLDPLVRARTLIEFFALNNVSLEIQGENNHANTFYIIHPLIKHFSVLKHNDS